MIPIHRRRLALALALLLGTAPALAAGPSPVPGASTAPGTPPAPAPEAVPRPTGQPLAVEATALLPLENESALSIIGIRGQIVVETRQERELRVICRGPGESAPEIPVGIWSEGGKLIVAPPPGDTDLTRRLHVDVPLTFPVKVFAANSEAIVLGSDGNIELHGTNLHGTVNANTGSLTADLVGGVLGVTESNEISMTIRDTEVKVSRVTGNVSAHTKGGKITVVRVDGAVDVDSEQSTVAMARVRGPVRVRARKGDVTVDAIEAGAELELAGAKLHLQNGRGEISVTSDSTVDFNGMGALLRLDMNGGMVRGGSNQGPLEARTRGTEMTLESVTGPVKLLGDGLKASVTNTREELSIESSGAEIVVDGAGPVTLKLDRSNATVRGAGAITAAINGGNALITDDLGAINLNMDGGDAVVSWVSMPADKDSHLVNETGSVTAHFPKSGYFHVVAKSQSGRVDSDLPGVKVADDLGSAEGSVNRGVRPVIRIEARGDVHLINGTAAEENNEGTENKEGDEGN